MSRDVLIEKMARAIVLSEGLDPDGDYIDSNGRTAYFTWNSRVGMAEAALKAYNNHMLENSYE